MFKTALTFLSLIIAFLTFQAYSNTTSSEKYELNPGYVTSDLNSEKQSDTSYSIKYSFFEKSFDKVYYIYDKSNTSQVLYKFSTSMLNENAALYKKLDGEKYKKVLSFERDKKSQAAAELGYEYAYNVLDENNNVIAHFYYKRLKSWYDVVDFDSTKEYTGGFELRTLGNKDILIQGLQPNEFKYKMELTVAPKLSKDLLLAVSNFMVPRVEAKSLDI